MGKSIRVITKKKRGRPVTTGKGTLIGVRLLDAPLASLDDWIHQQREADLSRPEAIRRLVEIGLTVKTKAKPKQMPIERATRARELAAKAIEKVSDPSASSEERMRRRRRLTRGPLEFRDERVDLPETKRVK